jgi:hypothetical protein
LNQYLGNNKEGKKLFIEANPYMLSNYYLIMQGLSEEEQKKKDEDV